MKTWDVLDPASPSALVFNAWWPKYEGQISGVFCLEASRLARNGRDWHHLIELCGLLGTLLVDPEGIYDPRLSNDRLLLGCVAR
jgi:hypothetical protein